MFNARPIPCFESGQVCANTETTLLHVYEPVKNCKRCFNRISLGFEQVPSQVREGDFADVPDAVAIVIAEPNRKEAGTLLKNILLVRGLICRERKEGAIELLRGIFALILCLLATPARGQLVGRSQMVPPTLHLAPALPLQGMGSPAPPSNQTLEIPTAWLGCWSGTSTAPDSVQRFHDPLVRDRTSFTKTICFSRGGMRGTTLTSDKDHVEHGGNYFHSWAGKMYVVSSDDSHVRLRESGDAIQSGTQSNSPDPTHYDILQHEESDWDCIFEPGGNTLLVRVRQSQWCSNYPEIGCDGSIWLVVTWHVEFHRVAG